RFLAWLDYLADEERLALDSLIELYAGERSGDVLGHVRGLSTLALVLMTLRAFALARRRLAEADTLAHGSDDPTAIANAALVRGWIEFVTGALDEAQQSLQQAAAAFDGIGEIQGWVAASCLLYWSFYCK